MILVILVSIYFLSSIPWCLPFKEASKFMKFQKGNDEGVIAGKIDHIIPIKTKYNNYSDKHVIRLTGITRNESFQVEEMSSSDIPLQLCIKCCKNHTDCKLFFKNIELKYKKRDCNCSVGFEPDSSIIPCDCGNDSYAEGYYNPFKGKPVYVKSRIIRISEIKKRE